jgi:hypothetical protein
VDDDMNVCNLRGEGFDQFKDKSRFCKGEERQLRPLTPGKHSLVYHREVQAGEIYRAIPGKDRMSAAARRFHGARQGLTVRIRLAVMESNR